MRSRHGVKKITDYMDAETRDAGLIYMYREDFDDFDHRANVDMNL